METFVGTKVLVELLLDFVVAPLENIRKGLANQGVRAQPGQAQQRIINLLYAPVRVAHDKQIRH